MPATLAIEPGTLRHRVQIQAPSTTSDSFGQPTQEWKTIRYAYASIEDVKEREYYQTGQFSGNATHLITTRWTPALIDNTMRVLFKSQIYKIQNANNVEQRNVKIKLICQAINEGTYTDPKADPK